MNVKFGDIVKDRQSQIEGVVFRTFDDGGVSAATALGSYGYNGINVTNDYRKDDSNLIHTSKKDIALAIKMQCHYAIKEMERLVKLYEDGELSSSQLDDLLLNNHLYFINAKK